MAVAVPGEDDLALAQALIARWKVGNAVTAGELVAAGRRLREWISANLRSKAIRTEVPMRFAYPDGRISEGFIDMLVEKEDGSVVMIDHKVINDHSAETCVKTYAAQQEVYRNALMATGCRIDRVYLHLPAGFADAAGNPLPEWFAWRDRMWADASNADHMAIRFPAGKENANAKKTLYSYWKEDGEFKRLGYIDARKHSKDRNLNLYCFRRWKVNAHLLFAR